MQKIERKATVTQVESVRLAYCNNCSNETNHTVLYSKAVSWKQDIDDEFIGSINGEEVHSLIECKGCDTIRMLHEHWFSEDQDERGPTQYTEYHPANELRRRPDWLSELPKELYELRELVGEIYQALGGNSLRLAAMGIRSLVEKMMIDRVGDNGSFAKNIAKFFAAGFVAPNQQEVFEHTLIEAGHAAMHRDWEPRSSEIVTLLDIVEGIIKTIYVDNVRAEKVAQRIPPRPARRGQGGIPAAKKS